MEFKITEYVKNNHKNPQGFHVTCSRKALALYLQWEMGTKYATDYMRDVVGQSNFMPVASVPFFGDGKNKTAVELAARIERVFSFQCGRLNSPLLDAMVRIQKAC